MKYPPRERHAWVRDAPEADTLCVSGLPRQFGSFRRTVGPADAYFTRACEICGLKAIRECYAIAPACDRAGIGRTTYYRWLKDTRFAEAVEQARQDCVDDVESRHFEAAKGKDTLSRIHLLKSHRREVYGDHGTVEVEHHHNPPALLHPHPSPEALAGAMGYLIKSGLFGKLPTVIDADAKTVEPPKLTEGEQKH